MPARATKPQPGPKQPTVVVIAGPNGAGKSTAAPYLLKDALGILEFVNADQIAAGLSAYAPETVAFEAGRIMLQRLRTLAAARSTCEDWRKRCAANRERFGFRYDAPGTDIYAPGLLKRLSEVAPADAIIACDVGQHQMWVAQHCKFTHPRNHLTSGALGTMGFGLPAAMGAQFACPDRTVILVNGDGGFMMNVQELATIARCKLPVKIVLIDNSALGMVRQWQELFFAERYSEIDLSDNPDFAALARVFGIPAHHISQRDEVEGALADLLAKPGPALLHVTIDIKANVWPLVPPNHVNSSMLDANPAKQSAEPAVAAVDPEKKNALPA